MKKMSQLAKMKKKEHVNMVIKNAGLSKVKMKTYMKMKKIEI